MDYEIFFLMLVSHCCQPSCKVFESIPVYIFDTCFINSTTLPYRGNISDEKEEEELSALEASQSESVLEALRRCI